MVGASTVSRGLQALHVVVCWCKVYPLPSSKFNQQSEFYTVTVGTLTCKLFSGGVEKIQVAKWRFEIRVSILMTWLDGSTIVDTKCIASKFVTHCTHTTHTTHTAHRFFSRWGQCIPQTIHNQVTCLQAQTICMTLVTGRGNLSVLPKIMWNQSTKLHVQLAGRGMTIYLLM